MPVQVQMNQQTPITQGLGACRTQASEQSLEEVEDGKYKNAAQKKGGVQKIQYMGTQAPKYLYSEDAIEDRTSIPHQVWLFP